MYNLINQFSVYAQERTTWENCTYDGVPTFKCLEMIFENILGLATNFIVLVLFIMFVNGAFQYLTSFGNADKVKKAQGTLKFALLGFIIFMSAFIILKIIDILFLGRQGKLFQFSIDTGL